MNINNLLVPNQFGFRKGHSTDYAIIQLYDKIIDSFSNKEHIIGIFMDLSKAFDTIDHLILLHKLESYGIRGQSLSWFKDYLHNRKQFVVFNSNESFKQNIQCGVPQGSILGPLLFLIYVNDLINSSPSLNFILFADDTNILYSHKNIDTLITTLNLELSKVSLWFKCNKLSLNIDKTNFIYFRSVHSQKQNVVIQIDGRPLVEKHSTKFLGLTIESNLSWNEHVRKVHVSISRNIGILYKIRDFLTKKSLFTLYNALILPHIIYCNIVWGNCSTTKINSLLLLQKRALRIVTNSNYLAHSEPLFYNLKTLQINDIHTWQTGIFMYKYTFNQLPSSFQNTFTYNSTIHSYPARHATDYHLENLKQL